MKTLWNKWRIGIWSGVFGMLAMLAVSLVLRTVAGIGTLLELLGDRVAPMLPIRIFFGMIGFFGSYRRLKEFGIMSMLGNELLAGLVFGLLYLWLRKKDPRTAVIRLALAIGAAFVLSTAFLWGNFGTSYIGLPPATARFWSMVGLALTAIAFGWGIVWAAAVLGRNTYPNKDLVPIPAMATHVLEMGTHSEQQQASDARRRMILVGGGSSLLALVSAGLLARFYGLATYPYDGTINWGPDLPPVTPNDKFYAVTKNNVDPDPTPGTWALAIRGSVRQPMKLKLADIQKLPGLSQQTTLQCISNPVGGGLSSNAVWTGVPLSTLLGQAGVSDKAVQVMFHGADGFIDVLPMDAAMHPYTLVVHQMNGENLAQKHGFPVRLLVPGYVGEKSVKWLTEIEVRETPGEGFYEKQGWGPHFAIENASRFDVPDDDASFKINAPTHLKGTAFAGDRGVRAVQVSADGGDTWQTAELTYPGTKLTWAQWAFQWIPDKLGDASLSVRCIDGMGGIQSDDEHNAGPGQASGYEELGVHVTA